MLPQNFGHLLFNAVRETLETMAFAEVIPCSIKVGDAEFTQAESAPDDFVVDQAAPEVAEATPGWGETEGGVDSWGTAAPEVSVDNSWGTPSEPVPAEDPWGTPSAAAPESDSWGEPPAAPEAAGAWGEQVSLPGEDPWGDTAATAGRIEGLEMKPKEINFDELVEDQEDWCWACMKVNSPDIHSIWFIVSRSLAMELARNMYAGEDFPVDSPLIRDLIAELTNVLGGRLMLLLEEMGGKFTLTVPEIGFGMPQIPESTSLETVLCKVVVDGEYPVIASICFNQNVAK